MPVSTPVHRPQRWDVSFDPEITEAEVDRILSTPPFRDMNPENFPKRISLRDIVYHDTRIRKYRRGEFVVREGDYGTSAFMIMSGTVRVTLSPLPLSVLGRREPKRKSMFRILAQLWSDAKEPESFKVIRRGPRTDRRANQTQLFLADAGLGTEKISGSTTTIFLQDIPRVLNEYRTAVMEAGEFFGEIAALSRRPRSATVFADTRDAELLEIRWQGLRDLMRYDESLRLHIDRIYRERALASHLRQLPMFRHLSPEQVQKVMNQTQFATYGEYDWSGDYKRLAQSGSAGGEAQEATIAAEGDYPNGVVLIRSGFARVSQQFGHGHRTLNYLGAGQHYGFQEIAHNWRDPGGTVPLQHTLRVIGYTHVLVVPTATMEELVLPTIPKRELPEPIVPSETEANLSENKQAVNKIGPDLLEFFTENRFFNGTATMIIDLDRCTRCDDCVRACAATHDNNPRFLRHGPSSGKVMVANACMHCADPVCMIGCPTGAIHRHAFGGQVVINPATCIGCQACFHNCPYDAIRMVEVRDQEGAFLVDDEMKPILKATKCDLCVDQITGPACARACPHSALARVNMNDLDSFVEWLKR